MDADLITIFAFVLVVLAIVFPFAFVMYKRSAEHEERKLELEARIAEAKAYESRAKDEAFQLMEDRMRVLERIVTDPGADLSRKIEDLRSQVDTGMEDAR